jgi:hypothetical protein
LKGNSIKNLAKLHKEGYRAYPLEITTLGIDPCVTYLAYKSGDDKHYITEREYNVLLRMEKNEISDTEG